jgi:hypothetical protein
MYCLFRVDQTPEQKGTASRVSFSSAGSRVSAPVRKSISSAGLAVSSRRCFWRQDTQQPWLRRTMRSLARSGSRLTTLLRPRDEPPAPSTGTGEGGKVSPAFVAMLMCLGGHLSDRPGHLDRSSQVKLAGRKPRTVSSTDMNRATVGAHNENKKKRE